MTPLFHCNRRRAQHKTALLNGAACGNAHESFSSAARQYNNSRASTPIPKHLTQTLFLVFSQYSCRLEINWKVGIHCVVSEIVLFQCWIAKNNTALVDMLKFRYCDLFERLHINLNLTGIY